MYCSRKKFMWEKDNLLFLFYWNLCTSPSSILQKSRTKFIPKLSQNISPSSKTGSIFVFFTFFAISQKWWKCYKGFLDVIISFFDIIPLDTGRKLNVRKTFRRLCTFKLRHVSWGKRRGKKLYKHSNSFSSRNIHKSFETNVLIQ